MNPCTFCNSPTISYTHQAQEWAFCRNCLSYSEPSGNVIKAPFAEARLYYADLPLYLYPFPTPYEMELISHYKKEIVSTMSIDQDTVRKIEEEYKQNKSISSIASSYHISRHTISGLLKGLGYTIKKGRPPLKKTTT